MRLFFFLYLYSSILLAQTKGTVIDEQNNPIPYATVWVDGLELRTTTNENGFFQLEKINPTRKLIISAFGFKSRTITQEEAALVTLSLDENLLEEVIISSKKQTKFLEVKSSNQNYGQAFDNGPKIDVTFFPFLEKYKKTPYIQKIIVYTDSKLDDAMVKLLLFKPDKDGKPAQNLLPKEIIFKVKFGINKKVISLEEYSLGFPKEGLFVGLERLFIENNIVKVEKTDSKTQSKVLVKTVQPLVIYNLVERNFQWEFKNGVWIKKENITASGIIQSMFIQEPAINLMLTN